MLILISFIAWSNPQNHQGVDLPMNYRGARYQNLWFKKEKREQQIENNIEFFMHGEAIRNQVKNMYSLDNAIV